jgi:ferritin
VALTKELEQALNAQVTLELESAHQYLALSAWLECEGLPGMAHWMRMQSGEENEHAMKFFEFLIDRNASVKLGALPAPKTEFDSVIDVFRASLAAEQRVTAAINNIYAIAVEARDFASYPLLDWFVNEQVEEEATVQQIIDDLERTKGSGHALLMLDREMGARRQGEEG